MSSKNRHIVPIDLDLVCPCYCGRRFIHGHLVMYLDTGALIIPVWSQHETRYWLGILLRVKTISADTNAKILQKLEASSLPEIVIKHDTSLENFCFHHPHVHAS